jgi:hypothetical protein
VAASPLYSQRQRQSGANEDPSVEGASDLGSGGMGVLPVEKVLGFQIAHGPKGQRVRTGRDRERQRSHSAARAWEDNAQRGSRPALTKQGRPHSGEAESNDRSWCTRHPQSAAPFGAGYAAKSG